MEDILFLICDIWQSIFIMTIYIYLAALDSQMETNIRD